MEVKKSISSLLSKNIASVVSSDTVETATWVMLSTGVKTIPVLEKDKTLVGVLSIYDLIKLFTSRDTQNHKTLVNDVMTTKLVKVSINETTNNLIEVFKKKYYVSGFTGSNYFYLNSIPIVDNVNSQTPKFLGLVYYQNILQNIIGSQKKKILSFMKVETEEHEINEDDSLDFAFFKFQQNQSLRQLIVIKKTKTEGIKYPIGILYELHVLKLLLSGDNLQKIKVKNVMREINVMKAIKPNDNLLTAIKIFENKDLDIKIFPVTHSKKLIGTLSYIDILYQI